MRFKLLFQQLSGTQDELLTRQCCTRGGNQHIKSYSLQGFCDASQKAYAVVVYLQVKAESSIRTQFLCSKIRVAPSKGVTIPRLELLSALLLARLISTVKCALESEITLDSIICYTDSQVALCW